MSYTVKAATVTAVRDSISTPVLPTEFTDPVIRTANFFSSSSRLTSAWVMWILWHNGIRFGVCLDAIIPANCATVKTSPLWILFSFTRLNAVWPKYTLAVATESLLLSVLLPTSTICAWPCLSTWLSFGATPVIFEVESFFWDVEASFCRSIPELLLQKLRTNCLEQVLKFL